MLGEIFSFLMHVLDKILCVALFVGVVYFTIYVFLNGYDDKRWP